MERNLLFTNLVAAVFCVIVCLPSTFSLFICCTPYTVRSLSICSHGPCMQSPSHLALYAVTQSLYAVTQPHMQSLSQSPSPICSHTVHYAVTQSIM